MPKYFAVMFLADPKMENTVKKSKLHYPVITYQ